MCLPKFDISQGAVAQNVLRATKILDVLIFLQNKGFV